ncbi:cobalamin-binding protein, partial [Thermogutta sp.]|uniref:ABC transporter substrate-binding protein n=1 Tax=Thermogutta sp. TaxID=1962930 RepID=UPI00321F7D6C
AERKEAPRAAATEASSDLAPSSGQFRRIVSMAPSITETLFALGCGDRVVAVTDFCEYPPEVRNLPRIGGYINPNLEAVLRLRPDLVVAPAGAEDLPTKLQAMGLHVLTVDHRSIDGVFDSLSILGKALGVEHRAEELAATWRKRLDSIAQRCRGQPRPRVLVVVDRPLETSRLQNLCAAGSDGFLNKLVELAGGENVLGNSAVAFPIISAETVLRLNPEVIIEIQAGKEIPDDHRVEWLAAWEEVKEVAAVQNRRVYLLGKDVPVVPGPRMINLAEILARCIHPECFDASTRSHTVTSEAD